MNKKIVYAISLIFAFNNISALPTQPLLSLSPEDLQQPLSQLLLRQLQLNKFTPEGPISHYTDEKIELYNAMGMWNGTRGTMTASFPNGSRSIHADFHPINGPTLERLNMVAAPAVFQQLKSAYAAQQNK